MMSPNDGPVQDPAASEVSAFSMTIMVIAVAMAVLSFIRSRAKMVVFLRLLPFILPHATMPIGSQHISSFYLRLDRSGIDGH